MLTSHPAPDRLLLMGVGAVGGVIAGGLLATGHDLTLVTHNDAITEAISARGLRLTTPDGVYTVPAAAHTTLDGVDGPFDAVLLAMKATGVEEAVREVALSGAPSHLSRDGYVVTLQNGIVEDRVAGVLGRERVIGALVGWGATMEAPGIYAMTSRGETVIGELDGADSPRVRALKAVLDAAAPTTISTNLYGALWSKLTINCVVTTLGAVSGQLLGKMLMRADVRRIALALVSEVVDVAIAAEVALEPVGGTLNLQKLYLPPEKRLGHAGLSAIGRHALMLAVGIKFRRLKSSMLQSLERGREPEIAFLNGYVVHRGRELGVATPVNAALTDMVREIEAGTRPIHPENLALLA